MTASAQKPIATRFHIDVGDALLEPAIVVWRIGRHSNSDGGYDVQTALFFRSCDSFFNSSWASFFQVVRG